VAAYQLLAGALPVAQARSYVAEQIVAVLAGQYTVGGMARIGQVDSDERMRGWLRDTVLTTIADTVVTADQHTVEAAIGSAALAWAQADQPPISYDSVAPQA
jgi:hypothetical protein